MVKSKSMEMWKALSTMAGENPKNKIEPYAGYIQIYTSNADKCGDIVTL